MTTAAAAAVSFSVLSVRLPVLLAALAFLAACSATPPALEAGTQPTRDIRVHMVLALEGVKKLEENRYDDASRLFNAALKFSPNRAELHFMNGLTYHLQYLRGDEEKKGLAASGYHLALEADPAMGVAAMQLGRLELAARRYPEAAAAFAHATRVDPQNGAAWMGLAGAAYYAMDLGEARRAIANALPLMQDEPGAWRAATMIQAASDRSPETQAAVGRYAALEPDATSRERLASRVEQWRHFHLAAAKAASEAPPPTRLAQAGMPPGYPTGMPGAPTAPGNPVEPNWSDCAGAGSASGPGGGGYAAGGPATSSGDETTALPALPAPCRGTSPAMAILDVVIVRTENNASSSYGINLLDGLTYVFNQTRTVADVLTQVAGAPDTRNVTITRQRSSSFPGASGFSYSLNIANSTDARSEVLARPSLVVLDRKPSTFFSGRNLTLGLPGGNNSSSTIADRAVGVSLSVTPTFLDANSMLLSVRAARSFLEPLDFNVAFPHSVQASRNSVSANVAIKTGQTLILSGLSEQEVQRGVAGVPVLQDIPALQYLFGNKTKQVFTRSVLIAITPRKVANDESQMARALPELERWREGERKELVPGITARMAAGERGETNLDATYKHLLHNELFLQFRSGDIRADDWSQPSRLESLLRDVRTLLYF
jgi:tetratricopeptide (TPR) repeat protein